MTAPWRWKHRVADNPCQVHGLGGECALGQGPTLRIGRFGSSSTRVQPSSDCRRWILCARIPMRVQPLSPCASARGPRVASLAMDRQHPARFLANEGRVFVFRTGIQRATQATRQPGVQASSRSCYWQQRLDSGYSPAKFCDRCRPIESIMGRFHFWTSQECARTQLLRAEHLAHRRIRAVRRTPNDRASGPRGRDLNYRRALREHLWCLLTRWTSFWPNALRIQKPRCFKMVCGPTRCFAIGRPSGVDPTIAWTASSGPFTAPRSPHDQRVAATDCNLRALNANVAPAIIFQPARRD